MNILSLKNVVKKYQHHLAVDEVSFDMPEGCIFGLLGPNGAGKTSIIRIITSITRADSGTVYLNGEPLNSKHPAQIGYMPEERGLYKKMEVGEHIMYLAQLRGLAKADAKREVDYWLEKFEIKDWWNKKVEELSKGMQQKIQFISTVIHRPKLLILDEPFSGLDPINANLIKDEIYEMKKKGVSIIFSTHRMEQVEKICEHIVLINQGKNVLEGTVKEVKNQYKENKFEFKYEGTLPDNFNEHGNIVQESPGEVVIQLNPDESSNDFLKYLINNNTRINSFNEILPTLNEVFIRKVKSI